ncbi:2-succinylbenzoate--CoA ligase [Leptolyngbya ohadii]|uniref:2-succinylbenzoate--CoA ligase n=1 Tax=Leptolyngbya ohadii TaxID=1962290 RepID=UPI000B59A0DC|nr:2-succinylbenzoate--CoA ligase [Leptolyngbya ohadii]
MRLDLLEILKERASQNWLIGLDAAALSDRAAQRFQELTQSDQPNQTVLLAEPEAIDFLAGFIAAVAANCSVFLGNPQWQETEWQTVLSLVNPVYIWTSEHPSCIVTHLLNTQSPPELGDLGGEDLGGCAIAIPTGGTSGQIRFALHTWETLTASVSGFRAYFQTDCVNSCCVLPLFHVSGLMQFMRSFLSGGKFALFASKELEPQIPQIDPSEFFISLVPTQLQRLLDQPENIEWLSRFQTILLGGAPAWSDLLETARSHHLRIASTYGMTETASQVVALKPEDFLRGQTGCGQPLPHAQITVCDSEGELVEPGIIGTVCIRAKSLCRGYFPPLLSSSLERNQELVTDDLGYFDSAGYLHLVGRNSQKIITGGENVFPAEVEAAIRQTGLVQDVYVIGLPDRIWGEAVTAVIVPITPKGELLRIANPSISDLESALSSKLTRYKQPKRWIMVDRIPRSPQGKVNYEQIRKLALEGSIASN